VQDGEPGGGQRGISSKTLSFHCHDSPRMGSQAGLETGG
jgi:hypothetical protein